MNAYQAVKEIARLKAQPSDGGVAGEPVAWMSAANLASFKIDRERYPGGGAGDLATARYMKAGFYDVPLYAAPVPGNEGRELWREELARIWLRGTWFDGDAAAFEGCGDHPEWLAALKGADALIAHLSSLPRSKCGSPE